MLIGYVRCSTQDQNPALQRDSLAQVGCERVYEDLASGAKADRPGLKQALDQCRSGDTLVVWKLDRLGRPLRHIIETIDDLGKQEISFRSLTEGFDTTSHTGRAVMFIVGALAEMERELIRERTRAGLRAATARGRVGGRRTVMTPAKIDAAKKLLAGDAPSKDIARAIGVSPATLYRWLPVKIATGTTEGAA